MEEWEIQYRKNQEDKRDGMSQLTDGQLEAIKEATEVIKELLGIGESLSGHMMIVEALSNTIHKVKVLRDPACSCCGDH